MSSNSSAGDNHNNGNNQGGGNHHQRQQQQQQQQQPSVPAPGNNGQPEKTHEQQMMEDSNKRAALAGQWRTPPLPVFPTSSVSSNPAYQHHQQHQQQYHHPNPPPPHHQQHPSSSQQQQQQQQQHHPPPGPAQAPPPPQNAQGLAPPAKLPSSEDDYAKALQEAYRRGAEAAAAMAAQNQHTMTPSVSCPNFEVAHGQPIATSRSEEMTPTTSSTTASSPTVYSHPPHSTHPPPPAYHHPQYAPEHPASQHHHHGHAPPPGTIPPPPPPNYHAPPPGVHPQPPPHHVPPPQHQHPHGHPYAHHPHAPPPNYSPATASSQQPPPPPPPQQQQHQAGASQQPASTSGPAPSVPNPLSDMPPPPPKQPAAQQQQPPTGNGNANGNGNNDNGNGNNDTKMGGGGGGGGGVPVPQQRSVSLPDMSSYAVQAEEEKRQKRLARNRASARLRRLRKKNLVDAYETEVGILEKTLQQLKAHEWGVPTTGPDAAAAASTAEKSHQSLLEALCMDRGQQVISSEQRAQQCQDILDQQLEQMEMLRQVQFEQHLLAYASGEHKEEDPEMAEMAQELNQVLNLSDEQKAQLSQNSNGLDEEMVALDTVFSSLVMMKENEWLMNQGVQDITDQLTSILHKNQMSKFLLWADANVEAIDQLDHVHAQPKSASHPQGPIFTFGVETTPMDDEGDGK